MIGDIIKTYAMSKIRVLGHQVYKALTFYMLVCHSQNISD
jgi:hypothetical protein